MLSEQIKELMQRAGFDPAAIERMGLMPNAEKFVELIIRECTSLLRSTHTTQLFADVSYDRGYFDGRCDGAFMIETHFGIE